MKKIEENNTIVLALMKGLAILEKFENDHKEFYYGLLIFSFFFFALAITIAVLGYVYYASVSSLIFLI